MASGGTGSSSPSSLPSLLQNLPGQVLGQWGLGMPVWATGKPAAVRRSKTPTGKTNILSQGRSGRAVGVKVKGVNRYKDNTATSACPPCPPGKRNLPPSSVTLAGVTHCCGVQGGHLGQNHKGVATNTVWAKAWGTSPNACLNHICPERGTGSSTTPNWQPMPGRRAGLGLTWWVTGSWVQMGPTTTSTTTELGMGLGNQKLEQVHQHCLGAWGCTKA